MRSVVTFFLVCSETLMQQISTYFSIILTVPARANSPTRLSSTTTSIEMEWNPVIEGSVARSYAVYKKYYYHSTWRLTATTTRTSTTINNLQSNTRYIFAVRARNEAGFGSYSNVATFQTGLFSAVCIFSFCVLEYFDYCQFTKSIFLFLVFGKKVQFTPVLCVTLFKILNRQLF